MPFINSTKPINAVLINVRIPTAKSLPKFSKVVSPPFISANIVCSFSDTSSRTGINAAVILADIAVICFLSTFIESANISAFAILCLLIIIPRFSASCSNSLKPLEPSFKVFTKATPSESKNLKANLTCSAELVVFCIPSATSNKTSLTSLKLPLLSVSCIPSCSKALLDSPKPCEASAALLINLCRPISRASTFTPVCSAANLIACKNSTSMPSLEAVLPSLSIKSTLTLTNAAKAVAAAVAANPIFATPLVALPAAEPTPLRPLVTLSKATLVESIALIRIL